MPANLEIVRRIYRDFGAAWTAPAQAQDLERYVDPEVELDLSHRELNPAVYRGYEGLRRSSEEVREVWERWRIEPEHFEEADDRVVVVERYRGRGRESGVELEGRAATIWTLRDGRVLRLEAAVPVEEAFAAIGRTPPAA